LIAALNSQGALTDNSGMVQIKALINAEVKVLRTAAGPNTTVGGVAQL
jgi:hypothetical protein